MMQQELPKGFEKIYDAVFDICNRKIMMLDSKQDSNSKSVFEMEVRFGRLTKNTHSPYFKFVPGVDPQIFFAIEAMLLRGNWEIVHKWTHISDYFHKPHQVVTQSVSQYDALRISNIDGNVQQHIAKKMLEKVDFQNDDCYGYDIRIALAQEIEIPPDNLKIIDLPYLVRVKHRKSFFLIEQILDTSLITLDPNQQIILRFRYDLTAVWENQNKTKVEQEQLEDREPKSYEIEIEFEGVFPPSAANKSIVEYATKSLLHKIASLASLNSNYITVSTSLSSIQHQSNGSIVDAVDS